MGRCPRRSSLRRRCRAVVNTFFLVEFLGWKGRGGTTFRDRNTGVPRGFSPLGDLVDAYKARAVWGIIILLGSFSISAQALSAATGPQLTGIREVLPPIGADFTVCHKKHIFLCGGRVTISAFGCITEAFLDSAIRSARKNYIDPSKKNQLY